MTDKLIMIQETNYRQLHPVVEIMVSVVGLSNSVVEKTVSVVESSDPVVELGSLGNSVCQKNLSALLIDSPFLSAEPNYSQIGSINPNEIIRNSVKCSPNYRYTIHGEAEKKQIRHKIIRIASSQVQSCCAVRVLSFLHSPLLRHSGQCCDRDRED